MSESHWQGSGGEYTLSWGGRAWTLSLDEAQPGLSCAGDPTRSKLLSLYGLAAAGRFASAVFSPDTLLQVERYRARVQATFAPPDWGGLTVRAAWSPSCAGVGVDLDIQASATSVGQLRAVEVLVQSEWSFGGEIEQRAGVTYAIVHPRDARSAGLSYDGRATPSDLRNLNTAPVGEPLMPVPFTPPGVDSSAHYLEMVQPNDVARQIRIETRTSPARLAESFILRYGLFGHDIEKGVVFRARLRACWLRARGDAMRAITLYQQFLDEPPPLGP